MSIPRTIDGEAVRLLEEANWLWNDLNMAFIEARDPVQETTEVSPGDATSQITYEEIQHHGLARRAIPAQRDAGLQWLRGSLSAPGL